MSSARLVEQSKYYAIILSAKPELHSCFSYKCLKYRGNYAMMSEIGNTINGRFFHADLVQECMRVPIDGQEGIRMKHCGFPALNGVLY